MKNKGFLSRSRIGDSVAHKEVHVTEHRPSEPSAPVGDTDQATPPSAPPKVPKLLPSLPPKTRRHTLALKISAEAADHLAKHLAQFPAARRPIVRRAIFTAFLASIDHPGAIVSEEPAKLVRLRLDLRLSDDRRDRLLALANQGRFEPVATALARLLSGQLAAFLEREL